MDQEKDLHHTTVNINDSSSTLDELLDEHGLELGSDSYLRWQVDSKQHPRNWNWKRKCFDIGFVMFVEMFQYVDNLDMLGSWLTIAGAQ